MANKQEPKQTDGGTVRPPARPGNRTLSAAALSRLMRGLNHDLKNPIGAADGYLDLLENEVPGPLDEEQVRMLRRTRALLATALTIVDDVVTFARASTGELKTHVVPTDLRSLVRLTAQETASRIGHERVALELDIDPDVPELPTDPDRVGQILRHLIGNALEYTPEGGTVRVMLGPPDGAAVRIAVSDTGPGIAAADLDKAWMVFEKLEAHGTQGVGFGLPLSRALASLLGGHIEVETAPGAGSTFTLVLPVPSPA